jgi:hypothetical protein
MVAAMDLDLNDMAGRVRRELDAYAVPKLHPAALGHPLPKEWIEGRLAAMRQALVEPRWIKIRDTDPLSNGLLVLDVALVAAEEDGTLLVFDPQGGEFVLAQRDQDPDPVRAVNAVSCGVRGDAVGCFLSA